MTGTGHPDFHSVLVVIPVYNHASTLRDVVEGVLAQGLDVLVVDDGSTDMPGDVIRGLGCSFAAFPRNRGKGAAIIHGAGYALEHGYSHILTVDADGQFFPEDVALIAGNRPDCPAIVIGERKMDESAPPVSHFGRSFSNFWVKLETGVMIPDTQSGLRLYPVRELLELKVRSGRFAFEVEVLARAVWAGLEIISVPVRVYYPPAGERISHFHKFRDNFFISLVHARLVLRSLVPLPHRRLVPEKKREMVAQISLLHPGRLFRKLCSEHNTTVELAVSAWTGIFLGALPLVACHTLVIIYVTHRLHMNKVAAVASSQLCCAPVVPVICVETGYFMRNGELLLTANWQTLVLEIPSRLYEWFLGSLVVGPILGGVVGLVTWYVVRRLRKEDRCPA
jgi:glycosyltransferase involved in cell wall biosynthesis